MARALRSTGIAYVILEQHGGVVREAREHDEVILFGDGTNPEVLERVGVKRARVIVFCIAAPDVERRGVAVARGLNPQLHIVVRTRYVAAIEELQHLGANEVVPEEFETSLEIFSRVLRRYGLPDSTLRREVASARRGHYEALRGPPPTAHLVSSLAHLEKLVAIETVIVEPNAPAIGENAGTLNLRHQTGATVIAVIRGDAALYTPDPGFRFMEGDAVVLVGVAEGLTRGAVLFRAAIAPE